MTLFSSVILMAINILSGVGLYLVLRNIPIRKADEAQTLCISYVVAGICGMAMTGETGSPGSMNLHGGMLFFVTLLGVLFFINFWIISVSSERSGVGITTTVTRMSVIMPVLVGIFVFHQIAGIWMKIIGLILAVASFLLIFSQHERKPFGKTNYFWPILVFFMSGICDTGMDLCNRYFATTTNSRYLFLTMVFFSAAIVGALVSIYDIQHKKKKISLPNVILGILLGLCNFVYMATVTRNLQEIGSAVVFPILNTSIVIITVVVGVIFYKEKLTKIQWFGIAVATIAVLLVALS